MSYAKTSAIQPAEPCCASVISEALDTDTAEQLSQSFAALADPVRLRLFNLIAQAGEICSCDLVEPLQKSQPTISHHTKILVEAGLIEGEKRGRWTWWSVRPQQVDALRSSLAT